MMDDIVLFEIPIYSMDEQKFHDKWDKKIVSLIPESSEELFEKIKNDVFHYCYRKQTLWKYNQIVGYITVNVWNDDITFNIYKPLNKKIRYDSPNKPYMEDWLVTGTHFPIYKYDDAQLISLIKSWVIDLKKEYVKKPLFIDTSLFDAAIECIDIKKMIKFRKEQKQENQ